MDLTRLKEYAADIQKAVAYHEEKVVSFSRAAEEHRGHLLANKGALDALQVLILEEQRAKEAPAEASPASAPLA